MAQEWNIKPRGGACAACARSFADREVCVSVLSRGEAGFARGDYCVPCWEAHAGPAEAFSVWQGEFHVPDAAPQAPLRREDAESLLRRLVLADDPEDLAVVYILAVMLERSRVFVERDVKVLEDESVLRVYERRKTGETFLVHDPGLKLDELEGVQQRVLEMLGVRPGADAAAAGAVAGDAVAGPEPQGG